MIRLADVSGTVLHHMAKIWVGEVCVPLAVVALCFSNAQDQTIPSWEELNKIALALSVSPPASPDNTGSAVFAAGTDFYSSSLQGHLSHFPDCECVEVFLGISSLTGA